MFITSSGIKRSFYCQTGQFQFGVDIILSGSNSGVLNFGLSGSGVKNINFLLSGGKIIDNNGKFLSTYSTNNQLTISGNINPGSYDILVDKEPILYNNSRQTGIYNYFYISPKNISCSYNLFINGQVPNLSVSNINCFTGNRIATGYIINTGNLPVRIFSGQFTNISSSLPFSLSGLFTGDLFSSGKFYILPSGGNSAGFYTGNIQLTTNAGILKYPIQINITGSPLTIASFININGLNNIGSNTSQFYTTNIISNISTGLPVKISLSYSSGTGNFFGFIPVITGRKNIAISGFIFNSGLITQFLTGIGTGQGGFLNNVATGFSSGIITGFPQFATGFNLVWSVPVFFSGYGTGKLFSGIGTGLASIPVTGSITGLSGTYVYNGNVNAKLNNLFSLGPTGFKHGTGAIFYNSPLTFDKLYVNDPNTAIVNNFTYVGLTGLNNYLNNNTGIHLVTSITDNINQITLSGLYGGSTNVSLYVDSSNMGTMSVSNSSLIGGLDLGIGQKLVPVGRSSGYINTILTGSGFYTQHTTGYLYGSGKLLNYIKTFTGSWDLSTGSSTFNQLDYLSRSFFNTNKSVYQNNFPVNYRNSTAYMKINYNNIYDSIPDVALLTVSGLNTNNILAQILITGIFR